jgi:hypothetical protein
MNIGNGFSYQLRQVSQETTQNRNKKNRREMEEKDGREMERKEKSHGLHQSHGR